MCEGTWGAKSGTGGCGRADTGAGAWGGGLRGEATARAGGDGGVWTAGFGEGDDDAAAVGGSSGDDGAGGSEGAWVRAGSRRRDGVVAEGARRGRRGMRIAAGWGGAMPGWSVRSLDGARWGALAHDDVGSLDRGVAGSGTRWS